MTATEFRPATATTAATTQARPSRRRIGTVAAIGALAVAALGSVTGAAAVTNHVSSSSLHVVDRTASGPIHGHVADDVTAYCNPGETAVGGGFRTQAQAYGSAVDGHVPVDLYAPIANHPADSGQGWTAGVLNRSDHSTRLTVHVLCTRDPIHTQVVQDFGSVDGPRVNALCPSGAKVLSGGWDVGRIRNRDQVVEVLQSAPVRHYSDEGWGVQIARAEGAAPPYGLTPVSYALCATSGISATSWNYRGYTIPAGHSDAASFAHVTATCQYDRTLTGAGVNRPGAAHGQSLTQLSPEKADKPGRWGLTDVSLPAPWHGDVQNTGAHGTFITVCATV